MRITYVGLFIMLLEPHKLPEFETDRSTTKVN